MLNNLPLLVCLNEQTVLYIPHFAVIPRFDFTRTSYLTPAQTRLEWIRLIRRGFVQALTVYLELFSSAIFYGFQMDTVSLMKRQCPLLRHIISYNVFVQIFHFYSFQNLISYHFISESAKQYEMLLFVFSYFIKISRF